MQFRRIAPSQPLQQQDTDDAAAIPEQSAALSGISRASHLATASIQRIYASIPPLISAVNVQNLP
ncbi:MAG: hypothetical protein GC179_07925 [Anaerolineaceae bacterium]|nr:hypothetical protein [Anaerolineaceae bacterium]